jgi:hypothetical protein
VEGLVAGVTAATGVTGVTSISGGSPIKVVTGGKYWGCREVSSDGFAVSIYFL